MRTEAKTWRTSIALTTETSAAASRGLSAARCDFANQRRYAGSWAGAGVSRDAAASVPHFSAVNAATSRMVSSDKPG